MSLESTDKFITELPEKQSGERFDELTKAQSHIASETKTAEPENKRIIDSPDEWLGGDPVLASE